MFAYRELLFFFVWRDISARYKQTVLGRAWAVIQPLMLMGIFTFVFGRGSTMKFDCRSSLTPCRFRRADPLDPVLAGMPQSALSLVNHYHLLTKVYFPRFFLPVAAASVFLVDMAYSLGIYAVILADLPDHAGWTASSCHPDPAYPVATLGFGDPDGGPDALLSRLPARRPVPCPDLDVRYARYLSGEYRQEARAR